MGVPLSGQCEVGHFGGSAMVTSCDAWAKHTPTGAPADTGTDFDRFFGFVRLSAKCSPRHHVRAV